MSETHKERRQKKLNSIKTNLEESDYDVWYIKSEYGTISHISLDGITFCNYGSGLISEWSRNFFTGIHICYQCLNSAEMQMLIDKQKPVDYQYKHYPNDYYDVYWRCSAIVKKKGKKLKRCLNCSGGPDKSFCSQHEKCFMKYINQYILVSHDVSKLIYKLL